MSAAGPTRRHGWLRRALTENLLLKVIALIGSVGLFLIGRGTEDMEVFERVRVMTMLPPSDSEQMLISDIPSEVRVTLAGRRSVLNAVSREGLRPIEVDLRNTTDTVYYFEHDQIQVPPGANVIRIVPPTVQLTWAERGERRIAIEAILDGELRAGLRFATPPVVEPSAVRVRGAAAEVARIERVRTQPIDLAALPVGEHSPRVPLEPLSGHASYTDTVAVVVRLSVDEEEGERFLEEVEVAVVGGTSAVLRPSHVRVRLLGVRARVAEIGEARVVPYVDIEGLASEVGAQPVPIQVRGLPSGIRAEVEPAEVLVIQRP